MMVASRNMNKDVEPIKMGQSLTPLEIAALRLRDEKQRHDRDDYHPDTNLFHVMLESGSEWSKYYVDKHHGDKASYREAQAGNVARKVAIAMTRAIQIEYDISLKDWEIGHLYGESHEFALHALGYEVPIPARGRKNSKFKEQVARLRRTKRYIKEEYQQQVTETGEQNG